MKKITLLLILVTPLALFSQTPEERDKMFQSYNMENINNLLDEINLYELNKKNRIEAYLIKNPNIKRDFYSNKNHYIIYDIIEEKPVYRLLYVAYAPGEATTAPLSSSNHQ